jgi:hypothetical protein
MTSRLPRILLALGLLVALAMPAAASAHHGRDRDRGVCRAVANGRVPGNLTAAQAQQLAAACTARRDAIRAAATAFDTATQQARAAYRATVTPLAQQVRTAAIAKRDACRNGNRGTQACADARAAFRTVVTTVRPQIRTARRTLRAAIAPARQTYRTAVRAAQQTFRTTVNQVLGRS